MDGFVWLCPGSCACVRFLASSIGVTCAAALALPLAAPARRRPRRPRPLVPDGDPSARPPRPRPAVASTRSRPPSGSTQSLPLAPLAATRLGPAPPSRASAARGTSGPSPWSASSGTTPDAELHGRGPGPHPRHRHRPAGPAGRTSRPTTHEHAADLGTAERDSGRRCAAPPPRCGSATPTASRSASAPETRDRQDRAGRPRPLPGGMRLELVDPGAGRPGRPRRARRRPRTAATAPPTSRSPRRRRRGRGPDRRDRRRLGGQRGSRAARRDRDPGPVARRRRRSELAAWRPARSRTSARARASSPASGWGADEKPAREGLRLHQARSRRPSCTTAASGNNYTCAQAPSVLRSIYRYHVMSSGWRDIGYNFAVDKCGNIYEGRAGRRREGRSWARTPSASTPTAWASRSSAPTAPPSRPPPR